MDMFSTLASYGLASPENYLTEALAFVLRTLLRRSPGIAIEFLNRLAPNLPEHAFTQAEDIGVHTQVTTPVGRPDLCITQGTDTRVYVEIKHDSPLEPGQLEAYFGELKDSWPPNSALVFLSRSKGDATITTLPDGQFHHVCWYHLHTWLSQSSNADPVCSFLAAELLAYLKEKAMDLPRIEWQYDDGVRALINLAEMMEASYREVLPKGQIRRSGGWFSRGFYVDNAFFYGLRYSDPMLIVFENNFGNNPSAKAVFDMQARHFLALTQGEQLEALIDFVKESLHSVPRGSATTEPPNPAA